MTVLSAEAERHVEDLLVHYTDLGRWEAIRNLGGAVQGALRRIGMAPMAGLPAPRPYPELARAGRLWIKEGRYWFVYDAGRVPPIVLGVYWDAANMPGRL